MRMISDDSLLTIVFALLVPEHRHRDAAAEVGPRLEIELASSLAPKIGSGTTPGPSSKVQPRSPSSQWTTETRDHALEPLELAEDEGPVRPRTGERDDQMIAPGLRLEAAGAASGRDAVRRNPVAERRFRVERNAPSGRGGNRGPLAIVPAGDRPCALCLVGCCPAIARGGGRDRQRARRSHGHPENPRGRSGPRPI